MFNISANANVLSTALSKALKFASKDMGSAMRGLFLKADGNGLAIIAVNGLSGVFLRCEATVNQEGEIVVPGKEFAALISSFRHDAHVTLSATENSIEVTSGKSQFSLWTVTMNPFPKVDFFPKTNGIKVPLAQISQVFSAVRYAIAKRDVTGNAVFEGVNLSVDDQGLSACATDNTRLASCKLPVGVQGEAVHATVQSDLQEIFELMNSDQVTLHIQDMRIVVTDGRSVGFAQNLEGAFPDFQSVLPQQPTVTVKADGNALLQSLSRANIVTGPNHQVEISIDSGVITLSVHSELGRCKEHIDVSTQGDETFRILASSRYLVDALSHLADRETVILKFAGPDKPILIEPMSGETLAVVLPLKDTDEKVA